MSGGGLSSVAGGSVFHWWRQVAVDFVGRGCQMISSAAGGGFFCRRKRIFLAAGVGRFRQQQATVCFVGDGRRQAVAGGGWFCQATVG